MKDFSKAMVVIGISLGVAMLPISIISAGLYFNQSNKPVISDNDRIPFSRGDKSRIEDNICIVGIMNAQPTGHSIPAIDSIFLVPPTFNLSSASVSAYCMWERTNGHFGRPFSRFFPIFSNGVVDTSIVIGACYNREDVPSRSTILFSDERFKFYKDNTDKQQTEEKGIYIFIENTDDNYPMPVQNQTAVYQLIKKGQNAGDGLFVQHDR